MISGAAAPLILWCKVLLDLIPATADSRLAVDDLRDGLGRVRLWWLLGITDLRQRYSRSRLGQFWITLSMALFVGGIGVVNSSLFKSSATEYIPHLATSFVAWTLISGVLNDATVMFVQAAGFLRQQALPRTVIVMRILVRHAVAFAHNLVIVPIALVMCGVVPGWEALAAVPGLVVAGAALFGMAMALGVLSTRFRDLPQIVQNLMQLAFFVSPVMWKASQLSPEVAAWVGWNPLAMLLTLVAEPLQGRVPPAEAWGQGLAVAGLSLALGFVLFARFRARLVYWL